LTDQITNEILYGGGARGGKALSDSNLVYSRRGWIRVGDVVVGDHLVAPDGTYTQVTAVYPQGQKQLYKITFDDGSSCECDTEHLWNTWDSKHGHRDGWKVRTTEEIMKHKGRLAIPLLEQPLPGKKWKGPDPYILGLIIGDGTTKSAYTTIYTPEEEIKIFLKNEGWRIYQYKEGLYQCVFTKETFRDVLGRYKGDKKHVPKKILFADPKTRLSMLQGLLDTDGTCGTDGSVSFCTVSQQLAEDVQYLVRSLGGKSRYYKKHKESSLGGRGWYYHVRVTHLNKFIPFRLQRKKERLRSQHIRNNRYIQSIEPSYIGTATCFTVDHPSHQFVIQDGIVTHNTFIGCAWIICMCLQFPGSAWFIGRKELKRLKATTLRTFFKVCKKFDIETDVHFKYNAQQETITWVNGSVVFLVDMDKKPSDPEFDRLGSYDLTGVFIDEAQEVSVKAINVLRGRLSLLEGEGWSTIPKSLYTCNPAKNWIYADFYKPWKENKLEPYRCFIPALVTDNKKYVKDEYIENLKRADKVTVERLLYGNFEYDDDPSVLMGYDAICDLFTNQTPVEPFDWYVSCDVARFGNDKTIVGVWHSFQLKEIRVYTKYSTAQTVQILEQIEREYSIPRSHFIIDEDGVGGGVVDHFRGSKGFTNNAQPLQPTLAQHDKTRRVNYANLKSQCYLVLAEMVNTGRIGIDPISNTIRDEIVEELEQIKQVDIDKEQKIKVVSKEEMKEALGRSPDYADMMMMRMFFTLNKPLEKKKKPLIQQAPQVDYRTGRVLQTRTIYR